MLLVAETSSEAFLRRQRYGSCGAITWACLQLVINALSLQDRFERNGMVDRVMSAGYGEEHL